MNPIPNIPIGPTPGQLAERQAKAIESLREELSSIRSELERTRNDFARYKSDHDAQHESDADQRIKESDHLFRRDLKCAAFSVLFSLFLEHLGDVFDFLKSLF